MESMDARAQREENRNKFKTSSVAMKFSEKSAYSQKSMAGDFKTNLKKCDSLLGAKRAEF